jgi:hypothetical protein
MSDFYLSDHGSVVLLSPRTDEAVAWVAEHIPDDAQRWAGGVAIEPRYVPAIVDGLIADGLTLFSALGEDHEHRPVVDLSIEVEPRGFQRCVNPDECNPAAHGGVELVETCQCGATRRVNSTGYGRREYGPWSTND